MLINNDIYNCVIFHCGNIDVFINILDIYNNFFTNQNNIYFISCHNEEISLKILQYLPTAIISVIKNKGADIGGFLTSIGKYLLHPKKDNMNYFFFLHTKSNDKWRNEALYPLLTNDISNILNSKVSTLVCNQKYKYKNNKVINRIYIDDIFKRNNLEYDYKKYQDEYLYDINSDFAKNVFLLDPEFYKNYEEDLSHMSNEEAEEHWKKHGVNEFHRIPNANYIIKYGEQSFFVAGTMFAANKEFMKIFEKINLEYEFSILEEGYNINNVPRKIHAWEYFFGIISYCMGGCIIGIFSDGKIHHSKDEIFDLNVYRESNHDLSHMDDLEINNHYLTYRNKEKRIISKRCLMKKQNIINVDPKKSTIAFFLIVSTSSISGGYRTLLKYINYLSLNGYQVDIYFGNSTKDMKKYNGYSVMKYHIEEIINYVNSYGELNISNHNFFLGLNCVKRYSLIFANAWQISEAVYLNRHLCDNLGYIIQDEEYLFFKNDKEKRKYIEDTYKNEFKYFCVTKYLSNRFKIRNLDVYESFLGVNNQIYNNKFLNRNNEIVIAYYKEKPGRLPKLIEIIINILSMRYVCHIFPSNYDNKNNNIINHGHMNENDLSNLYNKCSIGIVFSNTNPSRLGYEMMACGLKVIEYKSVFTEFDMDCTKYKLGDGILELVKNEMKSHREYQIKTIEDETNNFLSFCNSILMKDKKIEEICNKLDIEIPTCSIKYGNKTAICISGSYRTFDFCKIIMKYNIFDKLTNYDVFVLLSDENETDIEVKINNIKDFFGDRLKYLGLTSEFDESIKKYEYEEYEKFKSVCDDKNVAFNTRAAYRRYHLNKIKEDYDNYEYTMILRFDIFYIEPVYFRNEIVTHNDIYFLGKTKDINIILNEIGTKFNQYLLSFDESLPILLRVNPEFIYNNVMNKFNIKINGRYFAMTVRLNNGGYNSKYYEAIEIDGFYIIRPKFSILPLNFNVCNYKKHNKDLQFMTDFEAKHHYIYSGRFENRKYI